MYGVHAVHLQQTWVQVQSPITSNNCKNCISKPRRCPILQLGKTLVTSSFALSHFTLRIHHNSRNQKTHFCVNASSASVGSTEYTVEQATKVAFQTSMNLPGCSSPLTLLGTGVREKVFAIVGVKVYAAGLYANPSIVTNLESDAKTQGESSLFSSIFQAPLEKSLQIVLVRDVDGKTFWEALDGAISPRIKSPTAIDELALSAFRSLFQGRSLKKGTFIILTWIDKSKMLVSVSADGIPTSVDMTIESGNVTSSLFDVFFGDTPVSPSLKASVTNGLASILN